MTLESWALVAEIGGAIAVIATLFYLAIQVKQNKEATEANTRSLRANASWDAEIVFAQRNERIASDPDQADLIRLYFAPDGDVQNLNESQRTRILFDVLSVLQTIQAQYFMWREGSLPDEIWDYRSVWVKRCLGLPVVGAFWEELKAEDLFSNEFIAFVERIQAESAARIPSGTSANLEPQ